MWALWGILAAVLLGIYDIFKKTALNNNAVMPVLFVSIASSAMIYFVVLIGSMWQPAWFEQANLLVPTVTFIDHLKIIAKAVLVLSSWILAFFAIKHLPLTIVSPIRATAPLWTLIGALLIFSEKLSPLQWMGISITLISFYLFSTTGKLEGINFRKNKWVLLIIAATLLGASSGLYDRYIIRAVDRVAVQVWTGIYQLIIMFPIVAFLWYPKRKNTTPFQWRWSIPLIGIFLILTDYFYFYAISMPDSLISIISGIRRSGVAIPFIFAALFYKEQNVRKKGVYLAGIITGVILMVLGSR